MFTSDQDGNPSSRLSTLNALTVIDLTHLTIKNPTTGKFTPRLDPRLIKQEQHDALPTRW